MEVKRVELLTREQVVDALKKNETVQKAAKSVGLSKPKFEYWMKQHGVVVNRRAKRVEPEPQVPKKEPWYKRLLKKGLLKCQ